MNQIGPYDHGVMNHMVLYDCTMRHDMLVHSYLASGCLEA